MTTFKSNIADTSARAPRYGSSISRVATLTLSGFLQASDDIEFFVIPKGATLVDMIVTIEAAGAGRTLGVGDAGDPNRYFLAAVTDEVTRITLIPGLNFVFTEETMITGIFNIADPLDGTAVLLRASYVLTP